MLTEKQLRFCEEYVKNGYKPRKAYLAAFDTENENTASTEAHKLLAREDIRKYIAHVELDFKTLGEMDGLDKKTIIKLLAEMAQATKVVNGREVPDYAARKDGITLFTKLAGDLFDKHEIIDKREDFSNLSEEELKKREKEILRSL